MATLTATRAAAGFPVAGHGFGGNLKVAYGYYELTANPTAGDIIQLCRLPKGAVAIGGWYRAEDIDTNATETLDIDIGWAANGTEAADADGFGNFGPQPGDAVVGYLPEGGVLLPLNGVLANAAQAFSAETIVQATVVAVAATFATGTISVAVLYALP